MAKKKIPNDPNNPYFFKNCFVCQEEARPDQVYLWPNSLKAALCDQWNYSIIISQFMRSNIVYKLCLKVFNLAIIINRLFQSAWLITKVITFKGIFYHLVYVISSAKYQITANKDIWWKMLNVVTLDQRVGACLSWMISKSKPPSYTKYLWYVRLGQNFELNKRYPWRW